MNASPDYAWQTIAVWIIVGWAISYLIWRMARRQRKAATGCGSCPQSSGTQRLKVKSFVSLDTLSGPTSPTE
jgi:hypothetical protein